MSQDQVNERRQLVRRYRNSILETFVLERLRGRKLSEEVALAASLENPVAAAELELMGKDEHSAYMNVVALAEAFADVLVEATRRDLPRIAAPPMQRGLDDLP